MIEKGGTILINKHSIGLIYRDNQKKNIIKNLKVEENILTSDFKIERWLGVKTSVTEIKDKVLKVFGNIKDIR